MENVAKLNFQFLMGAPACSWASAAELSVRCLEPAGHLLPCLFLNSPLLLGFPLALELGKKVRFSQDLCVLFLGWGCSYDRSAACAPFASWLLCEPEQVDSLSGRFSYQ